MEANKVLIAVGAISTDRASNGLRPKLHIRCPALIKITIRAICQRHSRAVILYAKVRSVAWSKGGFYKPFSFQMANKDARSDWICSLSLNLSLWPVTSDAS